MTEPTETSVALGTAPSPAGVLLRAESITPPSTSGTPIPGTSVSMEVQAIGDAVNPGNLLIVDMEGRAQVRAPSTDDLLHEILKELRLMREILGS